MRESLLGPLGFEQTTFATHTIAGLYATGHEVRAGGQVVAERWMPRSLGPAGSTLQSTITDMLRLASAQLDDPAVAVLRTTHADVRIPAWFDAWCLGCARFDWNGGPVWGWDGLISGQRAALRIVPDQQAAVALVTNSTTGRAMHSRLFADLMPDLFGITVPELRLEPSRGADMDLSPFAGVYAWPDRRVLVTAGDDALVIESERGAVEALAVDARTFLVDADDPDNPAVVFGAFDDGGRPRVLYQTL